jgi:hypothetical protein
VIYLQQQNNYVPAVVVGVASALWEDSNPQSLYLMMSLGGSARKELLTVSTCFYRSWGFQRG